MGTKGHTEIIVPNLTESYNSHVSMCEDFLHRFIHTIPFSVVTLFLNMRFSLLEGSPRRGDPILHSEVFPFCHRAHHSVGQRQGELALKNQLV